MRTSTTRIRDVALTAFAPMSWGTTYLVATELLPPNHPLLVAALRSLPIGMVLTLYFRQLPQGKWWWRILLLGGLNIGLFQALLFTAAYRLPGGVAATAGAIQPLLVVIFAWWLLGDHPSVRTSAAAIAGFVGVGFLVLTPAARLDGIGILAALAGAIVMGLGAILTKRWYRPVPLLVFTAWQLTIGGAMLLPIAILVEPPLTSITLTNLLGFTYLGVIGTGVAYALYFRGIERLKPTAVSCLGLLSPVVATLLGFIVLEQTLTLTQMLGVMLVLVSVLVGQQFSQSHQSQRIGRNDKNDSVPKSRIL